MSQMTAPVLRTTPLHSVHAAAGAFFTDADGWRMPLRYSCAPTEHRAVRTSAGIFDLSHMGEIKVTGPAPPRPSTAPWSAGFRRWRWGGPCAQ